MIPYIVRRRMYRRYYNEMCGVNSATEDVIFVVAVSACFFFAFHQSIKDVFFRAKYKNIAKSDSPGDGKEPKERKLKQYIELLISATVRKISHEATSMTMSQCQ